MSLKFQLMVVPIPEAVRIRVARYPLVEIGEQDGNPLSFVGWD
jgi:hypothetical protein